MKIKTSQNSSYQPARVYDCENHYISQEFHACLKSRTDYPRADETGILYGDNAPMPIVTKSICDEDKLIIDEVMDLGEGRLDALEKAGVTTGVISAGQGIEYLPKEDAVRLAQLTNNQVAEAMKKYPGRFIGTITLPTCYVEESVAELERAVKELGLQYWHTHSNYGNEYLYDEKYEPILAKCAELNVPFYIHPNYPFDNYLLETGSSMSNALFGFGVDVMRTSLRLILNGIFDRYPNLQMILGHMGEYYPYVLGRMDNRLSVCLTLKFPDVKCKHFISYYFKNRNIFMTTSGISDPDVIAFAMKEVGIDSIIFGSDYPYETLKTEVEFIKSLPISNEDKDKILYRNVETYILKTRTPKSA